MSRRIVFTVGLVLMALFASACMPFELIALGVLGYNSIPMESTVMIEPIPDVVVQSVPSIYNNIPQSRGEDGAFILGDPSAPVTIVVFADALCPHCQAYKPTVDQVIAELVATGQARFEHRTIPLFGPPSDQAAALAECADSMVPGLFWQANDAMMEMLSAGADQTNLAEPLAQQLALDPGALLDCAETLVADGTGQYLIDNALASEIGITGTPAVRLRATDGSISSIAGQDMGGVPFEVIAEAVAAANNGS